MNAKKNDNSILHRFFISYILILLIPLLLGLLTYFKTIQMVKDDAKKFNLSILEQSRDIIDRHLMEIDNIVERVALNPNVLSLVYMKNIKEGSPDIYKLISASNDLSNYMITNSFIREIIVYCKNSDAFIMSLTANISMNLLYGKYFSFGDMDYNEWLEKIAKPFKRNDYFPTTPISINGRKYQVITKIQSIPMTFPMNNDGNVLVFINESAIIQLLEKLITGTDGYAYIIDPNNRIIASKSGNDAEIKLHDMNFKDASGVLETSVSGKNMVVSYAVSSYNGWKYVAVLPSRYIMGKADYIRNITLFIILISLLFGLVLSIFLSYRNTKPIKDMKEMLKGLVDDNKCDNEYLFITGSISMLVSRNQELQRRLDEQLPFIRTDFFRRLLMGGFNSIEEIKTNLDYLGIKLTGSSYVVVILKIEGYRNLINRNILEELDASRIVIRNDITNKLSERVICYDMDSKKIAMILFFNVPDRAAIKEEIETMTEELYKDLINDNNIYISFTAGNIYESMADIGHSFMEAQRALDYTRIERDSKLIWYNQIPVQNSIYNYTLDTESILVGYVKSGDAVNLKKLMNHIYLENFVSRALSSIMINQLVDQLKGTVIRLIEPMGVDYSQDVLVDLSQEDMPEQTYTAICTYLYSLCESICSEKINSDEILKRDLHEYLEKTYINEDLTLYRVASDFGFSETYIYHFFKDKMGKTFTSYLENLRLDHACSLLTATKLVVEDIAAKVGYANVHSFRRAFKRCKGYTPSDLRNVP